MYDYWHKQEREAPLFPDIIWSRPESRAGGGKLAIIGGHSHGFSASGIAYETALEEKAGIVKVLLPDAIKKTVKLILPDAEYGPSNPSGSFSKQALDSFLEISSWADGVLLAGDMGRNSETAVLLEKFVSSYSGKITITQDSADYFKDYPMLILNRPSTLMIVSLAQLQKVFINAPLIVPITYGMTLLQLVEALHLLTSKFSIAVSVKHNDVVFVAHNGQVVTTENKEMPWRVKTAARASVYWMQNPGKLLESAVSSLFTTK